jgi:hypothetical protein
MEEEMSEHDLVIRVDQVSVIMDVMRARRDRSTDRAARARYARIIDRCAATIAADFTSRYLCGSLDDGD